MRWIPFPLALSLALAATAGLAADSPLRPEQMRQAMGLKLGAWKTKTRLVVMDIEPWPGGDRAEAEKAARRGRALMTDRTVQHQCLEDKPGRLSFPGLHPPPGCEFTRIEVRNGRLAVSSLCRYPGLAGAFTQAVEGTYTSERVVLRGHAMLPHPRGRLRMKVESESRFAGSCDSLPPDTLPGEED